MKYPENYELAAAKILLPFSIYVDNWPSYLTDLLSLRLVGMIGAKNCVKSLFSDLALNMARV